jgi:predicted nucleic acid-binding protein
VSAEFVDTNVWLYAYEGGDPRQPVAIGLLQRLRERDAGRISVQVLQEFAVNAARPAKNGMAADEVREALESMCDWPCYRPLPPDVPAALDCAEANKISFWDAMIVVSASRLGCSIIWTEDLNDGQVIDGVTIKNPFAESA